MARRLRAFNLAVWLAALVPGTMTFVRLLSGKWQVAAVDALVALTYASTPLLHRFGPLAAPLVFGRISFALIFWVTSLVGISFSLFPHEFAFDAAHAPFAGQSKLCANDITIWRSR